jgi:xylan 1,4-beta-xylosidase
MFFSMPQSYSSFGYRRTLVTPLLALALNVALVAASGQTNVPSASNAPALRASFPVSIRVQANDVMETLPPIWRFFGADEPNYATMKNGQKLIAELGALKPKEVYFRAHNLLSSGDGTPALKWGSTGAYDEDAQGNPIYNWKILDGIFDTYLQRGVRPYVEIGFMPKALSTHPDPYQHRWAPSGGGNLYTGWAYPPKDYKKWGDLVYEWTKHNVEKYGRAEVETWYFETWNEANIGYWRGTPAEFAKLHDYAIDGVKRALPTARVGGPDCAGSGGQWMTNFLEHCLRGTNYVTGQIGTPVDFVSSHAKGSPTNDRADGHVRMGIANQLRDIDRVCQTVASYPELKGKPIIIGESDPEGCAACQGSQLAYRNGPVYPTYTAACVAREYDLARRHGVNLEGALTWAFEFEDQPYFAGFRSLASNGIDKPVLNVFRMLSQMGGQRLAAESDHAVALDVMLNRGVRDEPDISALASLGQNQVCVMVWHYHDDDVPGPVAAVALNIEGLSATLKNVRIEHYRIDGEHSNSYSVWRSLGSPQQPTPEQYAQLEKAAQLAELEPTRTLAIDGGKASIKFSLPRQSVSLVKLSW